MLQKLAYTSVYNPEAVLYLIAWGKLPIKE